MGYCEVQDVRNALTPDGASSGTNTAADSADFILQDAVDQATADVDTYVSGPYESTDIIPDAIKFWTRDIAAYYATLTWRKGKNPGATDPVVLRYNTAIARLESIAAGDMDIPLPAAVTDAAIIVNLYAGNLFTGFEFNLEGAPAGGPGFDLWFRPGVGFFWTGN